MSWILFAVIGHLLNAIAFIIDKVLLTVAWKQSGTYATLIGFLSLTAVLAVPWVRHWPPLGVIPVTVAFGGFFIFALWLFFEALKQGEASRVVPIIGSCIPLFTLLGTSVFLHERFTVLQGIGFLFLLFATTLLSSGTSQKHLSPDSLRYGILSALLFAISSVCGKYAFDHADFLGVFIVSRLAAAGTGIMIGLSAPGVIHELLTLGGSGSLSSHKRDARKLSKRLTSFLIVTGQVCGALGFVGVTIALSRGSAPLVNALQATQYGLIVLVAWFGGKRIRSYMQEERTRQIVLMKSVAIIFVGIGLACIR